MAVKIPWKALSKKDTLSSKLGALSPKQLAFFAAAGLAVILGLVLRFGDFFGEPEGEQKAPVTQAAPAPAPSPAATPAPSTATAPTPTTAPAPSAPTPAAQPAPPVATPQPPAQVTAPAPSAPAAQTGAGVEQAGQTESPDQGAILVSKRPVEVLSAPSATASAMYGFPAGRPFRVIGREGSFTHIQDVESGAKGWIDEAALALPPRGPGMAAPSQPGTGRPATASADPKPRATKKTVQDFETTTEPAPARKRPGLFGGGGPFRGLFGGGN